MPPNSWAKVNFNTFSSAWMSPSLRPNCTSISGPSAIINAWGGFAYDSNRSDLLTFGGGHGDYCGNDIYRFRMSTLRWELAGISSAMTRWQTTPTYQTALPVDGLQNAPAVGHMYDLLTFLPISDRMIYFGGSPGFDGTGAQTYNGFLDGRTGPWVFNPALADPNKVVGTTGSAMNPAILGGRMWENRNYHLNVPNSWWMPVPFGGQVASSATVCESGRDVAYVRGPNPHGVSGYLAKYVIGDIANPAADQLFQVGAPTNHMGQADMAVDPIRRMAIMVGDSPNRPFVYWNLAIPGPGNQAVGVTQLNDLSGGFAFSSNHGMDYDAARQRLLLWNGASDVWEVTLPASPSATHTGWSVRRLISSGGPVGALLPSSGGANGKWKYAAELDVFVGLREAPNGDVWIYKPHNWVGPQ